MGIQKTFDLAGNLAFVEKQLTRYREAAEHATYALANFPAGGTDAQRKGLQDALNYVRQYIGAITVRVPADRATVTVDGHPVTMQEAPRPNPAAEPLLLAELFVEPGPHTLVATVPGCDPVQEAVTTDKGSSHLITLTPTRCGTTTRPPPDKLGPSQGQGAGPSPILIGGFIATGVGLGLGTAFAIMTKVEASDATSQSAQFSGNPRACAASSPACTTLHDTLASHDTFANAAVWTFVGAGVLGVGTLVYGLAGPKPPPSAPAGRAQLVPLVGPGTAGLMVKGAF